MSCERLEASAKHALASAVASQNLAPRPSSLRSREGHTATLRRAAQPSVELNSPFSVMPRPTPGCCPFPIVTVIEIDTRGPIARTRSVQAHVNLDVCLAFKHEHLPLQACFDAGGERRRFQALRSNFGTVPIEFREHVFRGGKRARRDETHASDEQNDGKNPRHRSHYTTFRQSYAP